MKAAAKSLILVLFALLVICGCGYHNPYAKNVGQDKPAAVIYMTVWTNQTNELGLESLIFQKTADWLQQSRHLRITRDKDQADYLLTGLILSVDYPATAFSVTDVATTLKAKVKTSYRLSDRATGKTIWHINDTLRQTDYGAGSDAVRSQTSKRSALTTIADELAEQIYLRITATITSGS
ncbi:MAG: hypothetical protein KAS94_11710 [Desulfobulbaceae bacterium]|nr:hypothetical protein [Desulfobulbaceae bacterium]